MISTVFEIVQNCLIFNLFYRIVQLSAKLKMVAFLRAAEGIILETRILRLLLSARQRRRQGEECKKKDGLTGDSGRWHESSQESSKPNNNNNNSNNSSSNITDLGECSQGPDLERNALLH